MSKKDRDHPYINKTPKNLTWRMEPYKIRIREEYRHVLAIKRERPPPMGQFIDEHEEDFEDGILTEDVEGHVYGYLGYRKKTRHGFTVIDHIPTGCSVASFRHSITDEEAVSLIEQLTPYIRKRGIGDMDKCKSLIKEFREKLLAK